MLSWRLVIITDVTNKSIYCIGQKQSCGSAYIWRVESGSIPDLSDGLDLVLSEELNPDTFLFEDMDPDQFSSEALETDPVLSDWLFGSVFNSRVVTRSVFI